MSDGYHHNALLQLEADALRRHLEKRGTLLVTSDVTLVLRSDGKNSAPDIAVIEGEIDRSEIERAVQLRKLGARLIFALEVVSTSEKEIEEKDIRRNLKRYAAEGVADYFTVYPIAGRQVRDLVGRRLIPPKGGGRGAKASYVEVPPDAEGRVYSQQLDLYFQIDPASRELVAIDGAGGQRLLISDEEEAGRKQAEAARRRAEERAEQEATARRREAAARRRAEERAEEEAEARRRAEERAERAEEHAAQALRSHVEELCGLLEIEWSAERSTAVAGMGLAQLEALRADLLSRKRWP